MYFRYFKRFFDLLASLVGLLLLWPVIVICWVVATIETRSNGFFLQKRVGKGGKIFSVIKIKTMNNYTKLDSTVTVSKDPRITRSGAFMRNTKLDELPQLINVFFGSMSFVGPRPDVPGYADELSGDKRLVLSVRPGITGPAQIYFRNEEELLSKQSNPISYNDKVIWPKKVEINCLYVENCSFVSDVVYILRTLFK